MLAITEEAAAAIGTLATNAQLPDGGGLRITAPSSEQGLQLALVGNPEQEDVVLAGDGVTVFLEPAAAQVLDDKVLDVQTVANGDGEQELRFAIGSQPDVPPQP